MSPTQSVWFERFALGCLRRMGQDVHQDWAISLPAMQALMQLFEEEWSLCSTGSHCIMCSIYYYSLL
jgi:hypothetical protein